VATSLVKGAHKVHLPTHFGPVGTVAGLVGIGWARYFRFPHPAYDRDGEGMAPVPVPWSAIARRRGLDVDLASASWFDVSGVRPHLGRPIPGASDEPLEGMHEQFLKPRLVRTLVAAAHDQSLWTARWLGYNEAEDLTETTADRARVQHEVYVVRRNNLAERGPLPVTANYVWGESGFWLLCAGIDCMSTYVGVHDMDGLVWPDDLEMARVPPDLPVS
jgi:hypothetical protein